MRPFLLLLCGALLAPISLANVAPAPQKIAPVGVQTATLKQPNLYRWDHVFIGGGGTVTYVVGNPNFPDEIWAASDVAGPMKYDRTSDSWRHMADSWGVDNTKLLHTELIALDRTDADHIVYSAGKEWQTGADSIVVSRDSGATWKATPLLNRAGKSVYISNGRTGDRLNLNPRDGRKGVYGSRKNGLFFTGDGGQSWTQTAFPNAAAPLDGVQIDFALYDPTAPDTLYVAARAADQTTAFDKGIYRSSDGGQNWTPLPATPRDTFRGKIGENGALYALGEGVYRWNGQNWDDLTPPGARKKFEAFAISPADPNVLAVAENHCGSGNNFYRSLDGGNNWDKFSDDDAFGRGHKTVEVEAQPWEGGNNGAHIFACASSLLFDARDPRKLWLSHWPGIAQLQDIGAPTLQWRAVVKGHEEVCLFEIACPPRGPHLVSGVMDVGGFAQTDVAQMPPSMMVGITTPYNGAPEDVTDIDFCEAQPNFIAVTGGWKYQDYGDGPKNGALGFSEDGGKTWRNFAATPFPEARGGRIAVNAANPDNIVLMPRDTLGGVGKSNTPVYFSKDRGQSWQVSQGAPKGMIYGDFVYTFYSPLEADRVKPDTFYLYESRDGRFLRSDDGGANWNHVSTLPAQPDVHFRRHWVRAAPGLAGEVWVAADEQGLFRSSDGGENFVKLEGVQKAWAFGWGAPLDAATPPVAYLLGRVAGDDTPQKVALYRSLDLGKTWERINAPDNGWAMGIVVNGDRQTPGRVYVGTNGRGIFYGDAPVAR